MLWVGNKSFASAKITSGRRRSHNHKWRSVKKSEDLKVKSFEKETEQKRQNCLGLLKEIAAK